MSQMFQMMVRSEVFCTKKSCALSPRKYSHGYFVSYSSKTLDFDTSSASSMNITIQYSWDMQPPKSSEINLILVNVGKLSYVSICTWNRQEVKSKETQARKVVCQGKRYLSVMWRRGSYIHTYSWLYNKNKVTFNSFGTFWSQTKLHLTIHKAD